MLYLSQMLGKPVIDAGDERIGTISDIAIATGEVFPRVTAVAFRGPDKTPFMLSWRKYVASCDSEAVKLNVNADALRFSYLQPDELLLARDLLNKQIVDTQGMKVVRVNDLKLSDSNNSLRLLGAEVGMRGLLRAISPEFEKGVARFLSAFNKTVPEQLIAWNYMDLLEHDMSQVKLSVSHKRLHELHPADVADILEQLGPNQRAAVFTHLDNTQAAEAITELEDEYQADVIDDLSERRASDLLAEMDPDDAADVIGDLDYEKAERLLRLMGLEDSDAIRKLLGYRERTAGGIMTPEVTTATADMTVEATIEHIRAVADERENIHYVYVVDESDHLSGVVTLRELLLAPLSKQLGALMTTDLFTAHADDDQEEVAETISKYDLLAVPVVDEHNVLLGIVTIDDALDVLEEEAEQDLKRVTGRTEVAETSPLNWIRPRRSAWLVIWLIALFAVFIAERAINVRVSDIATYTSGYTNLLTILSAGLVIASIGATILPLLLIVIEEGAVRGLETLLEYDEEESPSPAKRQFFALSVGALIGLLAGVIAFALIDLSTGSPALGAAYGLTVLVISLLCSQILAVLVARAAKKDRTDDDPVSPAPLAVITMSLCAVLVVLAGTGLLLWIPSFTRLILG